MYQINEMSIETYSNQGVRNEIPLNYLKSLSKIIFENESFSIPSFKVGRMNDFMGNNDVRRNVPMKNKSRLV